MANVLITGGAGFIGYHLQKQLQHHFIYAIDRLDPNNSACKTRNSLLPNIIKADINHSFLDELDSKPDLVIHLAAETGVGPSVLFPERYFETNVRGTFNVLEQCRKNNVKYLIYASSSSVYSPGQAQTKEIDSTITQLSFYGTTKKLCETMIENYCNQFGIVAIGLRFFTVYGSWTRPDMAGYKFMSNISNGKPITIYNNGHVYRDFTHVSDVVKAIDLLIEKILHSQVENHLLFNIGLGQSVSVLNFAQQIALALNRELIVEYKPLPFNELPSTNANTESLKRFIDFTPICTIENGVKEMVEWFIEHKYE